MKTIFTLFASLFMGVAVFAAPANNDTKPRNTLTIQSADAGDLRVIIDGRRFEPNDNYLRIQGISAGNHSVKIYRERNTGLFAIFGKRYDVVFSNVISMKPFTSTTVQIDRFGKAMVKEVSTRGRFGRNNRGYDDRDDRNWDRNHDFNYDGGGNMGDYDNGHDGRIGNDRNGGYDGRDSRDYGYNKAMNDFEFDRVLRSIDKEWFEANKSKSASQIIQSNYLTAFQVKQLLQLFTFENTKLDLAKLAYTKTVDQKNYFLVNEVFSFNSSKDELARYIRSCE